MDVVAAIRSAWVQHAGAALSEHWFDVGLSFVADREQLVVRLPNPFLRERFRQRMHDKLLRALRQVAADGLHVRYEVDEVDAVVAEQASAAASALSDGAPSAVAAPLAVEADAVRSLALCNADQQKRSVRRRRGESAQLVRGQANLMAVTSVEMVLGDLGRWSPLFLHGPPGCGKTMLLEHLLQRARRAGCPRAVMLSAEQFTVDFLEALRGSGLPSFRRRYRDVQLLLLDDVQFLIGKVATRNELLHTLESLQRQGSQLVISADRPPAELSELGVELVARFSAGMVGAIDHPDLAMRRAMLQRIAPPGLLPAEVLELLAERIHGDARLLHGAVHRVQTLARVLGRSPDSEEAERSLQDFFRSTQRRIGLKEIVQATSLITGVQSESLESQARRPEVAHCRMLAMFLARKHTQAPLKEIAGYFNKRSHSTVVSACGEVQRWIEQNRALPLPGGGSLPTPDVLRRIEAKLNRA